MITGWGEVVPELGALDGGQYFHAGGLGVVPAGDAVHCQLGDRPQPTHLLETIEFGCRVLVQGFRFGVLDQFEDWGFRSRVRGLGF